MTTQRDDEEEALFYRVAGAAVMDSQGSGARVRDRLMRSLARGGTYGKFADRVARLFEIPVERAVALLAHIEDPGAFRPFMARGIGMSPVAPGPSLAGATAAFGRLIPGTRFPRHE